MLVLIRGAGDLASGIALRLHHAHLSVVMTDLPQPTAIRRTVCFSQAIVYGSMTVEDVTARFCAAPENAAVILAAGELPVLADPEAKCRTALRPDVVVDAILAKKNLGTRITDAPISSFCTKMPSAGARSTRSPAKPPIRPGMFVFGRGAP